jgi:hypothetical protein
VVLGQCVSAQTLDDYDCQYIDAFNEVSETSFLENFLFMNHNSEWCAEGINCYRSIRKRTLPVSLTVGKYLPSDREVINVALTSLGNTREWFSEMSGLEATIVSRHLNPQWNTGFIRVEIVDDSNAEDILASKFSMAKVEFKKYIEDERVKCLAWNGDWLKAGLEYSEVWIKADQSLNDISQCITEEVYHTFGVVSDPIGLASLYSDPRFLPKQTGAPNYTLPAHRDLLMMKVLYDDLIQNGDDVDASREHVESIILRDCG